jgi:hypothetical protein
MASRNVNDNRILKYATSNPGRRYTQKPIERHDAPLGFETLDPNMTEENFFSDKMTESDEAQMIIMKT